LRAAGRHRSAAGARGPGAETRAPSIAWPVCGGDRLGVPWLDEVPAVAVEIDEDGDRAVRLVPRLLREPHPTGPHLPVIPPEVVRPEEEEHPPTGLVTDPRRLLRGGRPRQEQSRAAAGRADHDPPLAAREPRVLHDREAQAAGEVGDGLVIV